MAIIGRFLQEGLTGSAWGACTLYTASPLRAFGNELGVQAPVGFLILLASRLREATRISPAAARRMGKQGRVSRLETRGYIIPISSESCLASGLLPLV